MMTAGSDKFNIEAWGMSSELVNGGGNGANGLNFINKISESGSFSNLYQYIY